MPKKKVFKNKLRFVTKELKSTESATVLILAGAGSRYETKKLNGISHFLEHMFFKGAKKYKTAKEVSEAVDSIGGDFNAFTGKEYVGYYIKVAARHIDTAIDVLADMLVHSRFDPREIDKERGVIMEEYNMYQDTPMYQVGWNFERLLYGDQPMGWDQVGTKAFINEVTQADFVKYKTDLYTPENLAISIAGNISVSRIEKQIEEFFGGMKGKKAYSYPPLRHDKDSSHVHLTEKKTEQSHVVVGFPAYQEEHKDHYVLKVLATILGGNMSSRMFLAVREAKGLAYYISTSTDDYLDTGVLSTRAGVQVARIDEAIKAITEEYIKIRGEVVSEKELRKAKEFLKGKLALRLEDSEEFAHLIGKHEILHGKIRTPDDIVRGIDAVSADDIARVSSDIFHKNALYCAVIGPYKDKNRFQKLLTF